MERRKKQAQPSKIENSIFVSIFRNKSGKVLDRAERLTLDEIEKLILDEAPVAKKDDQRLLKLAKFGDSLSRHKSIRHDDNVVEVHGIEIDYDGGLVNASEVIQILQSRNIEALAYTTTSNTTDNPRWRLLVSLQTPLIGDKNNIKEKRSYYCGIINTLIGGIAERESFTLSLAYFFGRLNDKSPPETYRSRGQCIDETVDLPNPTNSRARGVSGANTDSPAPARIKGSPIEDIQQIASGEHIRSPLLRLTARYTSMGVPPEETKVLVRALLEEHKQAWESRPDLWNEMFSKVDRMTESAFKKYGPNEPTRSKPELCLSRFERDQVLMPVEPERFLLPGLIPVESYSLIAGALSSFKTTFLHHLLLTRATGFDALGLCENTLVEPGPCVLLNYEDSDQRISRRIKLLIQDQFRSIQYAQGNDSANRFLELIEENLSSVTLTGQHNAGIVRKNDRFTIVPNDELIEELLNKIVAIADRSVLIGLDPLRLAITGSQNDDDGADVVVHALNMIATSLPDSALVATSHTTKTQAKSGASSSSRMDAAYATSGSALFSQHARSNFHLGRISKSEIERNFFGGDVTQEDVELETITRLTHGRLSNGPESGTRFFQMRGGVLRPVSYLSRGQVSEAIAEDHKETLLTEIYKQNQIGIYPSKSALEEDEQLADQIGRNNLRKLILTALERQWITNVSTTKNRTALQVTDVDDLIEEPDESGD